MASSGTPCARAAAIVALVVPVALAAACTGRETTGPKPNVQALCGTSTGYGVSLQPGGVATVTDPARIACMAVPQSSAASEYVFAVGNANTLPDAVWRYTVAVAGQATAAARVAGDVAAGASPDLVAAGAPSFALAAPRLAALGVADRLEARRQAQVRRLSVAAARALRGRRAATPAGARASLQAVAPPAVGDLVSYRVPDTVSSCDSFFTVGGRVRAVSQHAVIVQDTTAPAGGFGDADFASIAGEFDRLIYPTDTTHFGSPGDLDANGRVVILYTPRVNAETPRGSKGGYVAGFFFGGDLFPRSGPSGEACAQSNVGELFYLLTPDPAGAFSDPRTTEDVRQGTRGTIAHEFQHMINLATRIRENAELAEATWLDEALAHLAEELVGRAARGLDDTRRLTIADVADRSNNLDDFYAFFAQNLVRYQLWLEHPDSLGATSEHADRSLEVRGAAWSLVRYSADQYANGDVATFTRRLAAGPDTGVVNLTRWTGAPFDSIVAGWTPAHYTSGLGLANLPARATFRSWDMRDVESAITEGGSYPLVVTDLAPGATVAGRSPAVGASFFRLALAAGASPVAVRIRAPSGGAVADAGASVYIVRTR